MSITTANTANAFGTFTHIGTLQVSTHIDTCNPELSNSYTLNAKQNTGKKFQSAATQTFLEQKFNIGIQMQHIPKRSASVQFDWNNGNDSNGNHWFDAGIISNFSNDLWNKGQMNVFLALAVFGLW